MAFVEVPVVVSVQIEVLGVRLPPSICQWTNEAPVAVMHAFCA